MVGLQGTPVQNTLTELFALLHFLDPSEFPDPEQSAQEFAQVDAQGGAVFKDKGGMEQQVSRIHELLQPRWVFWFDQQLYSALSAEAYVLFIISSAVSNIMSRRTRDVTRCAGLIVWGLV